MLPELLYRDWILHRRALLISFGIFAAFQVYAVTRVSTPRTWAVFACIYAAFLAVTLFVRDDRFQATAWGCTLPVTRTEIVRARFVAAWVLVAGALAGALALAAVIPGSVVPVRSVVQPSTLLIVAAVATAILAFMQPLTIRFGLMGVMVFLIGVQLLGVAALSIIMITMTRASGTIDPIAAVVGAISGAVGTVRGVLPSASFFAVSLALIVLVNWLGYRLALWLFRRREL